MAEEEKKVAPTSNKDVDDNKVIAAIGYLGILFLIPLLAKKDSPYAQFHAKQGMVLFIFGILVSVVVMVPFIGWVVGAFGWLASVIFFIMGLINALGGKKEQLPVIGKYADQIKI